jgi:hypothetical protein
MMSDLAGYQRESLSIDQQLALPTAASRLAEEFTGVYGSETIEQPWPGSKATATTAARSCCSCAFTTLAVPATQLDRL